MEPKFKVGDKVRIVNAYQDNNIIITTEMKELIKKDDVYTIRTIGERDTYNFYKFAGHVWAWHEDWLELYVPELVVSDQELEL